MLALFLLIFLAIRVVRWFRARPGWWKLHEWDWERADPRTWRRGKTNGSGETAPLLGR
jgi:hypothetical protein